MSLAFYYFQRFDSDIWEFVIHSLKKKEEKKVQKGEVGRTEQEVEKNEKNGISMNKVAIKPPSYNY